MTYRVKVPIYWTCHGCGVVEREQQVRERFGDEEVVAWMRCVQADVGVAHAVASPGCVSDRFDLKIPMKSRDSRVGEAVRH